MRHLQDAYEHWTICPSNEQMPVPKDKQTHTRTMPLPFTIDGWIMGEYYVKAQYAGHGQSKVGYRLTDKLVLKLCDKEDQEPKVFRELQESCVYPKIYGACQCQVLNHAGWLLKTWHAWVSEYAKPLDQILQENLATSNFCILGAVHAMLTGHSRGHVLSDNSFFNFGLLPDNIVIIDAGSCTNTSPMTKGKFNTQVMRPFWSKAQTLVQPEKLTTYRTHWEFAPEDMLITLQTY